MKILRHVRWRLRRKFGFGLSKSYLTFGLLTCSDRSKKCPHSTLNYTCTSWSQTPRSNQYYTGNLLALSFLKYCTDFSEIFTTQFIMLLVLKDTVTHNMYMYWFPHLCYLLRSFHLMHQYTSTVSSPFLSFNVSIHIYGIFSVPLI